MDHDQTVPVCRPAPTDHAVLDVLAARWSARAIAPDVPVARADVARLLEAARWAPSSGNAQPWRYVVFDDTVAEQRERARACLRPRNAWALAAPVLLLSVVRQTWPDSIEVNPSALHDVGAASLALALQASALGLVCHQMAGFDRERARQVCGLPAHTAAVAFIAVGHPGRLDDLDQRRRQRELRPRTRRPIAQTATLGALDGPGYAG